MAKLVLFQAPDNQPVYINSEMVKAVVPKGGNAWVLLGDTVVGGLEVKGSPASVSQKLIG